jgi:hypothetical protein
VAAPVVVTALVVIVVIPVVVLVVGGGEQGVQLAGGDLGGEQQLGFQVGVLRPGGGQGQDLFQR